MALLQTQQINQGGLVPTYGAAASGGDSFDPDQRTFIHVKNGGASVCNVTIKTYYVTAGGGSLNWRVQGIAAGTERLIGPFDPAIFNDPNGLAQITYDQVASVTLAALRL